MVVPLCGPSSTVTTPRDELDDAEDEDSTEAIEAGPKLFALHEGHAADGTWILTRFSSHCETRCAGSEENGASNRPGGQFRLENCGFPAERKLRIYHLSRRGRT